MALQWSMYLFTQTAQEKLHPTLQSFGTSWHPKKNHVFGGDRDQNFAPSPCGKSQPQHPQTLPAASLGATAARAGANQVRPPCSCSIGGGTGFYLKIICYPMLKSDNNQWTNIRIYNNIHTVPYSDSLWIILMVINKLYIYIYCIYTL